MKGNLVFPQQFFVDPYNSSVWSRGNWDYCLPTWVSRYSSVRGMSSMDFAPAQTTAIGDLLNSVRSLETSMLLSPPLWTPPIPGWQNPALSNGCQPHIPEGNMCQKHSERIWSDPSQAFSSPWQSLSFIQYRAVKTGKLL